MPISTRTILWMSCFLIGIAAGSNYILQPVLGVWIGMGLLFLSGLRASKPFWVTLLLSTSALAFGFCYVTSWRSLHLTHYNLGEEYHFKAVIVAPPDVRQDKTLLTVLPSSSIGSRRSNILVSAPRYPLVSYGDQLELQGEVEKPEVFNGFNYPLYLESSNIHATIHTPTLVKVTGHNQGNFFLASLYQLRSHIEHTVQAVIPEPESSFLNGILLGSKRAIPADIQTDLKETGTSHIIAVSGANITILLAILLNFLPLYRPRQQCIATIIIAIFVTILTGGSASVLRGAAVACLGSYVRASARRAWTTPLVLLSMCVLVLNDPLLLVADPGFQLSFAAFAGLGWLGTWAKNQVEQQNWTRRLPNILKGSFAETLSASLGTAPLSFTLFGQLSFSGLLVNPLVLWLLPPITLLGLLLSISGWLPLAATLIKFPLWLLLHIALAIIIWFGRLDIGVVHWHPSWLLTFEISAIMGIGFLGLHHLKPSHAPP